MSDINFFAETNYRNQNVKFGIKTDDRRRHMYAIGKTGMGKTNLLENIVIQDIRNGHGVAYVDPHGDTAEKLLKAIPKERINDVVYFNPADAEFPVAFNILEAVGEDSKNLVASGMMGVFKKIWPDVWSARMEYILHNAILALLDYPGSTMLGVNRMMSDKDFRKRVYEKIKDPMVKSFWINEFDTWEDRFRKEAVASIQNKVGQFLSSSMIRNIVGQPKSTIDLREIMDKKKILIVNLSKGRIGEDAMRLLGGMLITKMQLAVMGRVDMPEDEREDFYLCVDEFQNFVTESFANILSEARKYRLNLIVAHQYVNQLTVEGNTTVRDAVFGNVGTIISFRVGAEDAEFLEKEFEPIFTQNDLVNLPKYHIYLKLMIDGVSGDAFSARALPPVDLSDTEGNEGTIIRTSRERYGEKREVVEEKVARWSGFLDEKSKAKIQELAFREATRQAPVAHVPSENRYVQSRKQGSQDISSKPPVQQPKKTFDQHRSVSGIQQKSLEQNTPKEEREEEIVSKAASNETAPVSEKTMFQTKCDTCGMEIEVPFKPDGKRPTFCKDCFKDYQRAVAKAKEEAQINIQKSTPDQNSNIQIADEENISFSDKKRQRLRNSFPQSSPKKDILKSGLKGSASNKKVYVSEDKPMSLSQLQHVAPKKFKRLEPKREPNISKIQGLIRKNLGEENKSEE